MSEEREHQWIRTVATDGQWCELCGLSAARWVGDPCPGEGAAREVERRMVERLAQAWLAGHAAGRDYQGDGWNSDAHDPNDDNPYRNIPWEPEQRRPESEKVAR